MKESTRAEYIRLAEHFISVRVDGTATPKKIKDALQGCAGEYRPAYWRRLRCALAVQQETAGYKTNGDVIRKLANPVTKDGDFSKAKPKQRRIKTINDADEVTLLEYLDDRNTKGDIDLVALIAVLRVTGVRPAEIHGMQIVGGEVVVKGAKQSHGGQRGADRRLQFEPKYVRAIAKYLDQLREVDIGPLQDRLRAACKELWPQRQALPTLYSWRHQMGAELKASGLSRKEVAYLMGHQATASVDVYGNSRQARGGGVRPTIPEGADLSAVRETHNIKEGAGYKPAKAKNVSKKANEVKVVRPGVGFDGP